MTDDTVAAIPVVNDRLRWFLVLLGPVLLAIAGATHPAYLTAESASWWHDLHVIAVPLFPLIGVTVWALLSGIWSGTDGLLASIARLLAFAYACFYTGLDVLSGIGAGATTMYRERTGDDIGRANSVLFGQGNLLADIATYSLFASLVLVAMVFLRRVGTTSLPGSVVLLVSSWSFVTSHIFWPRGVLTMLGFALGAALLLLAERRSKT